MHSFHNISELTEFAMADLETKSTDLLGISMGAHLVGVWNLISYTNIQKDGRKVQPFGLSPSGLLIYTPDGFVSAQLMDPRRWSSHREELDNWTPEEYQEFGRGYIGYCGRYEVDEERETVTHVPTVAFLPNLIGKRLRRQVQLFHSILTLTASYIGADGEPAASHLEWSPISSGSERRPSARPS
jgi:hypothetical protein